MLKIPIKYFYKNFKLKLVASFFTIICFVIILKIYIKNNQALLQLKECESDNNYCYSKDKNRNLHRYFGAKTVYPWRDVNDIIQDYLNIPSKILYIKFKMLKIC